MFKILNCGSSKTEFIGKAFPEKQTFKIENFLDFEAQKNTQLRGIIISGAPILVTEQNNDQYLAVISSIFDLNIPVLGICFGHQLIGLHYGAKAFKMTPDREINKIQIDPINPLFYNSNKEIEMQEDHCEWITIPKNFVRIGFSVNCENEAMMHETKSIFGIQFHPEVSGTVGIQIIQNFVQYCVSI